MVALRCLLTTWRLWTVSCQTQGSNITVMTSLARVIATTLVISNMMASIPAYNEYARTTLMPSLKPEDLALLQQLEEECRTDDPRYMAELMPNAKLWISDNGSHLAMYDDQVTYFMALTEFLTKIGQDWPKARSPPPKTGDHAPK